MFIRNVFYTFSTEILTVVANFFTGILLARALSVPERGVMVLVMTWPWTVYFFANLGLPQANIYFICRKKWGASLVMGNALLIALAIGPLTVALLSAAKGIALITALRGLPQRYWLPMISLIPVLILDGMSLSILRARQRFDLFNLRLLGTAALTLAGYAIVLLVFKAGLDAAASVYVAATLVMGALSLIMAAREVPLRLAWNRWLTIGSLQYGFKSYMQNLVGSLNYRLDIYLIAFFLTPRQVALYGIATSLAEVAWYIPNSVGVVLFPRLASMPEEDGHLFTARICRITLAVTALIVVVMLCISWFLVPLLYGDAYRASITPLLILLPGILAMSLYKVLTSSFTSRNRQQASVLAASVALVSNLGLDLVLIRPWGITGAALGSTTGYTVAGLVLLLFFLRESRLRWQEAVLPQSGELMGYWQRTKTGLKNGWSILRT